MVSDKERIACLEDEVRMMKEQLERQHNITGDMFAMLRNIGEAVIRIDAVGRIEWLNSTAVKMAGIINIKARGKMPDEVFHFSKSANFETIIDLKAIKDARTGKFIQADDLYMTSVATGVVYCVSCSVSTVFTGRNENIPMGYVLVLKDLTDVYDALHTARENERKLRIEQRRIRTLGDNLPNGCLYCFEYNTVTGEAGFTYLSGSWEKISGISVEAVLNNPDMLTARMYPDDKQAYKRAFMKSLSTMGNFRIEMRFMTDSGMRWGRLSSVPHYEDDRVVWDGYLIDVTENKSAELKLVAEKERLEAIGDNYPNGCLFRATMDIRTHELKLTYLSKPWEELTGIPAEAVLNDVRVALSRIHPDDVSIYMADTVKSAQTGENMNTDVRFVMDDGSVKWAQIASHPHREGHTVVWDGFFLDISSRKRSEAMLVTEKERMESISNNIPGTLYRFRAKRDGSSMGFEYVSGSWEKFMGLSAELAIADINNAFAYVHPDDMPALAATIRQNVIDCKPFNVELRYLHPIDGKTHWFRLSSQPRRDDDTMYADGIILDISAQKEAELKLLAEKERLEIIGGNIPGGALYRFKVNPVTREIALDYVSDTWQNVIGISPKEAIASGLSLFDGIEPADMPLLMERINNSIANMANFHVELRFHRSDGVMLWLLMSAKPSFHGDMIYVDGLIFDISARKNAEQNLLAEKERLRSIGDNMPEGVLYRSRMDVQTGRIWIEYVSGSWEKISGVPIEITLTDIDTLFARMDPDDLEEMIRLSRESVVDLTPFSFEFGYHHPIDGKIHRIRISSVPVADGDTFYADGTLFDVTESREAAAELELYRKDLERLVMERTDELMASNEELEATSEELHASNNELSERNRQLIDEIAARHEVMSKLEDSENKVRNFIRRSFEGILMIDSDGRIVEWNEAMVRITGITRDEAFGKYNWELLERFLPEEKAGIGIHDRMRQMELAYIAGGSNSLPSVREDKLFMPDGSVRYLQVSVFPIALSDTCYFGKVLRDVTERKQTEIELEQYRTQLEKMVEVKSRDLIAAHVNLEATTRRQALFIKVLQILQMEPDVPVAMDMALAELGTYTGVDRLATWENHPDGITYGCTYEWCNDGVEPAIQYLRSMTIEAGKPWFDMLEKDDYICTSDMSTLHPFIQGMLETQGVKAIAVFPMSILGTQFGFLSFNFCRVKEWDINDVELMRQMAQIMSTATRRWQVETALHASQRTMQKVLDNVNANIFVTDYESLEIIFANKRFRQAVPSEVQGVECWKMLNAGKDHLCDRCPKLHPFDEKRLSSDDVIYWDDYNPVTRRWYTIQSTAIQWIDGRWAIMELAIDTTDRKAAEVELIHAKEKAEESDRLKSAFLANVSHEIRTPLNGIIGFLHFLSSDTLSSERRREYIRIINNNGTQLVKLIDDIVDISKIEARQMKIHPVPVQINSLMADLYTFFDAYMRNARKEHVALVLDESGFVSDSTVLIDPTRLRQVLNNLLGNAIKFTEKGYVSFGYRHPEPAMLEFWVEDTGIGIPSAMHEIIFERFRQAETETGNSGRLYGGTGLGLAISRSLVQLMGGGMTVESTEGVGSTFRFTVKAIPHDPLS